MKTYKFENEDVLSGTGLDPEVLQELTDQEAKELAAKTVDEMFLTAHYYDDFFNFLGDMFKPVKP